MLVSIAQLCYVRDGIHRVCACVRSSAWCYSLPARRLKMQESKMNGIEDAEESGRDKIYRRIENNNEKNINRKNIAKYSEMKWEALIIV